jgi:hypothetical protein
MDRQRELVTLERLERRRGDTWQGLWLAPLATIVAQAFLFGVLADERIGWLARVAVLVAAVASCLAAIWSVLRAHAREVQLSEAIADWTEGSDGYHPDLRPSALSRPRRRRPAAPGAAATTPSGGPTDAADSTGPAAGESPAPTDAEAPAEGAAPEAETETVGETAESEGKTEVLDPVPPAAAKPPPAPTSASRRSGSPDAEEREEWVARWDRHLVWWASGETHAKAYMAWTATLALFALADVAVLLSCV